MTLLKRLFILKIRIPVEGWKKKVGRIEKWLIVEYIMSKNFGVKYPLNKESFYVEYDGFI